MFCEIRHVNHWKQHHKLGLINSHIPGQAVPWPGTDTCVRDSISYEEQSLPLQTSGFSILSLYWTFFERNLQTGRPTKHEQSLRENNGRSAAGIDWSQNEPWEGVVEDKSIFSSVPDLQLTLNCFFMRVTSCQRDQNLNEKRIQKSFRNH